MIGPSDVALEVWLGPMEGLRSVTPGGSRPTVIRVGRAAVDKKSNQRNEIVLPYDLGISATHAELRSERGRLVLKDAQSRNGTFAQSARVTGEKEIQSGDVFLVSLTPVRVFFVEEPLAELPSPTVLNVSAWREPVVQHIVRLAQETAARRGEPFADTRHLCDAFLRSGSPFVERVLRKANWSPQRALVELWDGSLLVGRHTWLKDLLLRLTDVRTGAGSGELMLSPKAKAVLEECQRDPVESSGIDVEQVVLDRLLRGLRQDAESLVGAWLARRLPVQGEEDETERLPGPKPEPAPKPKPKPEPKPEPVSKPKPKPEPKPEPAPKPKPKPEPAPKPRPKPESEPESELELKPMPKPLPEPEPEPEPVPDPRSDDGEQRRWADPRPPEPKAKSTPEDEPKPGDETYRPDAVEKQLRRRVAELERRLAEAESRPISAARTSSADEVLPWRTLLDQDDEGNSDLEPSLALLREVLRFSQDVEKFLLSQVQAMMMPGALTSSFHLPSFQNGLLAYLTSFAEGKEVDPNELRAYFTELKCWQIAISAGNHEAPKLWFGTLWKRINPSVIEAGNPGAKWNFLWEATDWWKAYRTLVEDLNADLVQDEVHKEAAKFAQTEFQKLSKRRK